LPIEIEYPVADNQWNFVFAARQIQGVLKFIAHEKCAKESGENVQPVNAQGVVVVPQHGCVLPIGVMADCRFAGHIPILRIAIALRRSLRAMQMYNCPHLGLVRFGAVNTVVDGQEMRLRELIDPLHEHALTAARFKTRSGQTGCVSPKASWFQVAVQFALELPHGDPVVRELQSWILRAWPMAAGLDDLWQRQRVHELRERTCIELRAELGWGRVRHRVTHAPAHGQCHRHHSAAR
jgi:hypothetical protein